MSFFGANKSKDIKNVVERLHEGTGSICNESVAANLYNEAEVMNLSDQVKSMIVESYTEAVSPELAELINEDAEDAALLFRNSMSEACTDSATGAMNENTTLNVNMLTSSVATIMRSPYEAVMHRLFDTRTVEKPVVTFEEVIPMVVDPQGNAVPIIEAFDPKKTSDYFVDKTEIVLTKLTDGIAPGAKNVNLLDGLDPLFKVDRSVRLTGITASEDIEGTPTAIVSTKIKMKKGSVPYFDVKDNTLSVIYEIELADGTVIDADISAKMDYSSGTMLHLRTDEHITKVFFTGTVSHEEHTHPISTTFKNGFMEFPIPTRPHIEVSVPQETQTDIANSNTKLSAVDIITNLTQQSSIVSARMEDQRLLKLLNAGDNMFEAQFDFESPANFVHGNLEWIKREFIPFLDQCALAMKAEYNIEDCHFRVGVSPYILKILDAEYTKDKGASEEQGGSGAINYSMAVKTSTSVFFLISSLAMPANKLHMNTIVNNFKESQIKTYNYFKYSSFMTDKVRKSSNPRLGAIVFSERNLPMVFTPLSTKITITNMPITKTSGTCFIKKLG